MELVKIAMYSLFLVAAIFLTLFNLLFSYRVNSIDKSSGLDTPRLLRRALAINTLICFTGTLAVAYALMHALTTFKMPDIL